MKSKKLKLDDSLFNDETIEIELPKNRKQQTNEPAPSKNLKSKDLNIDEYANLNLQTNNRIAMPGSRTPNSNRLARSDDKNGSIGSEYDFGSNGKIQQGGHDTLRPAIEYLNFDADSHMTIKTKKSSKFSLQPLTVSGKNDLSDSKKMSSRVEINVKKTQFAIEKARNEGGMTIKKLTTPPGSTNHARKNFKFDIALLSKNEDKRGRVVYPHSCKNVNMAAILEIEEIHRNSPMNVDLIEGDGSIDFGGIKHSADKMMSRLNSNAKMSEKSERGSTNIAVWTKKAQNYELKIDRLLLDQKFKIQNYKRMLDEKDGTIAALRDELDKYRTRCAELESIVAHGSVSGMESRLKQNEHDSPFDDAVIFESLDTAVATRGLEIHSSPAITLSNGPFMKLKKLSINIDEINDRSTVQISQFNSKPATVQNKFQTPNTTKERKSFKLHINTTSDTQESLQRIKEAVQYLNQEKSAPSNHKYLHSDAGYKPGTGSKLSSPTKVSMQPTSTLQFPSKASSRKLSSNDNRITESLRLKPKKLKISETPKVGNNNPSSFFAPSKDFFVHYKKDQISKYVTSNRDIKKVSSMMKSKDNWVKQDGVLETSQTKDSEKKPEDKKASNAKADFKAYHESDKYLDFKKKTNDTFFKSTNSMSQEKGELDLKVKFYKKIKKESIPEDFALK